MTKGMRVGYIRVSSIDQNTERQLENMELDKVFVDKVSGKNTDRPEFKAMMNFIRTGDHVFVHSMDRLGRNLKDLKEITDDIIKKGVILEFVKEKLICNGEDSPIPKLLFHLLCCFSEFEYSLIRERQREGIAIAKAKGVYGKGRPKLFKESQIPQIITWWKERKTISWIAQQLNVSRGTVYRYISMEKEKHV